MLKLPRLNDGRAFWLSHGKPMLLDDMHVEHLRNLIKSLGHRLSTDAYIEILKTIERKNND